MKKIELVLNDMEETRILLNGNFYNLNSIKYPSIGAPDLKIMSKILDYNVFYHGLAGKDGVPEILADTFIEELDLELSTKLIRMSRTKTLSFHLGNYKRDYKVDEMLKNLVENMNYLRANLPLENIEYISLENMEVNVLKEVINPEFITKAIELTDTYFLLDITHAYLAANILKVDPLEYIISLPLDKVKEIHFSGTMHKDNKIYSHIKCRQQDYALLEKVLPLLPNLERVILEYGTPAFKDKQNRNRTKFSLSLPRVSYGNLNSVAYKDLKHIVKNVTRILEQNDYYVI